MFYASRFMNALSELAGPISHPQKSEEDLMFDAVRQGKSAGLKPADAALSYFITQARRGMQDDPDKWLPIARQASRRVREWHKQRRIGDQYAETLLELVRETGPNEA